MKSPVGRRAYILGIVTAAAIPAALVASGSAVAATPRSSHGLRGRTAVTASAARARSHGQHIRIPANDPAIKKIKAAGVLKVGVTPQLPWLGENPKTSRNPWYGPSWNDAEAVAKLLKVKLVPVAVSQLTKVTAVQSGQVDISIPPLDTTAARKKVVNFVTNHNDGQCFVALKTNKAVSTMADLKKPGVTVSLAIGAAASIIPPAYPHMVVKLEAVLPGQVFATASTLQGKTDTTLVQSAQIFSVLHEFRKLRSLPPATRCFKHPLFKISAGWAIQKGDPAFQRFLQQVVNAHRVAFDRQFNRLARKEGN